MFLYKLQGEDKPSPLLCYEQGTTSSRVVTGRGQAVAPTMLRAGDDFVQSSPARAATPFVGIDTQCPTFYGCPGIPLGAPGVLPGALAGRPGGIFMGSSSLFWSVGVIFVLGSACCSSTQFDRALVFNVCSTVESTGRDGSIPRICAIW